MACFVGFDAIAAVVCLDGKDLIIDFDRGSVFPVVLGAAFDGEQANGVSIYCAAGGGGVAERKGKYERE